MIDIVGVRFKHVGKIYYFDPNGLTIEKGDAVIVETARGIEYGMTELANRSIPEESVVTPLKKVIRVATEEDTRKEESNKKREKEAYGICLEKIKQHKLDMKLIDVELTFDLTKIIFYFTSDGRVDFRELVKELASIFRMRIELRQIGVRDESKMLNGIGICGRTLCCATFLGEFQPVSIKMAKEQNLSLNPTKISGICGRLMCCLKYEEETYEYLNAKLPNEGDLVRTPEGDGEVLAVHVLRQIVKVAVRKKNTDDPNVGFYAVDEIKVLSSRRNKERMAASPLGEYLEDEETFAEDYAAPPAPEKRTPPAEESTPAFEHKPRYANQRKNFRRSSWSNEPNASAPNPVPNPNPKLNAPLGDEHHNSGRPPRQNRPQGGRYSGRDRQDRRPGKAEVSE